MIDIDPNRGHEPVAVIQRLTRFTYRVSVRHGTRRWGPDGYGWVIWGRNRAEHKASKALALYKRAEARRAETWEVGS